MLVLLVHASAAVRTEFEFLNVPNAFMTFTALKLPPIVVKNPYAFYFLHSLPADGSEGGEIHIKRFG